MSKPSIFWFKNFATSGCALRYVALPASVWLLYFHLLNFCISMSVWWSFISIANLEGSCFLSIAGPVFRSFSLPKICWSTADFSFDVAWSTAVADIWTQSQNSIKILVVKVPLRLTQTLRLNLLHCLREYNEIFTLIADKCWHVWFDRCVAATLSTEISWISCTKFRICQSDVYKTTKTLFFYADFWSCVFLLRILD